MLTQNATKEADVAELANPMDLCERMGMRPGHRQLRVMQRFQDGETPLDVADDPRKHLDLAAGMCALWFMLKNPGARVTVISSNHDRGNRFMGFLQRVTMHTMQPLASVCRWTQWHTMEMGDVEGHECRYMTNHPQTLAGLHFPVHLGVVLGAGWDGTDFVDTLLALEANLSTTDSRILRIW